MNAPTTSAASEINRLHGEVVRLASDSKQSLLGALAAAWQAGHLLIVEKERVWRTMGRGSWVLWLEQRFDGTPRTAQNYMRLAKSVPDASELEGMSLRQIYYELEISTEPKLRLEAARMPPLAPHIRFANKLLVEIRPCINARYSTLELWESYRRDLRPLYEQLRRLFETGPVVKPPANLSPQAFSARKEP